MEKVLKERMEAVNRAKEKNRKKNTIANDVVELLADRELTISDVKDVLDIVYVKAMNKAILK